MAPCPLPLPRARAFVFDLDGTLIDSRADIARACNHALVDSGLPALDEAVIGGFVGDGSRALMQRAVARAASLATDSTAAQVARSPNAESLVEAAHERFVAFYADHPAGRTTALPHATETLEELSARRLPLALVTNKPRRATEPVLEALGLTKYFGAIACGGEGPLKPDPAPVRRVLAALGADPAETWVIGDGPQDIGAAHAAGCRAVAVLGGFHDERALAIYAPDMLLPSLERFAERFSLG